MDSINTILGIRALYWTLGCIFMFVVTLLLILRSGRRYSVEDAEAHSTEYAGVIKEGHGGLTAFLWTCYAVMVIWTVVYFVLHAAEFKIWFAY
jgi:hypothetical protein